MTDWREALQDAMYPILTRLLQEGCVLPLFVTCIGRNGSMMCGRYDDIEATGLDFIVEASHLEGETFRMPLHMLVVDQRGEARHVRQEASGRTGHPCLWSVTARRGLAGVCGRDRAPVFGNLFWGDAPGLAEFPETHTRSRPRARRGALGGSVTRQATVRRAVCRRPPLLGSGPPTCGISTERRIG